jgi:hypothetical protein
MNDMKICDRCGNNEWNVIYVLNGNGAWKYSVCGTNNMCGSAKPMLGHHFHASGGDNNREGNFIAGNIPLSDDL